MSGRPHRDGSAAENRQRASLVLEAAIVLPVLLATIASIIVLGIRLSDHMYLTQAARELGVVLSRTPYMASLGSSLNTTYLISPSSEVDANGAASCLQTLTTGTSCQGGQNYSQCSSCAETVVRWYAVQAFQIKKMMTQSDLTLQVRFAAPPSDTNASQGLCMIFVSATANSTGWLRYLASTLTVSHWVPYVANPVPAAGQNCNNPIS
jgi:hypothetical protein